MFMRLSSTDRVRQKSAAAGRVDDQVDREDFFNAHHIASGGREQQVSRETYVGSGCSPLQHSGSSLLQQPGGGTKGTQAQADSAILLRPARVVAYPGQVAQRTGFPVVVDEAFHPVPQRQRIAQRGSRKFPAVAVSGSDGKDLELAIRSWSEGLQGNALAAGGRCCFRHPNLLSFLRCWDPPSAVVLLRQAVRSLRAKPGG